MQVRVASLATAWELAESWADKVVSLVDPNTDLPNFPMPHLVVHMHDTEVITDPWSPKRDDIAQVFNFCQPEDKVVVHCEGGISRSTAMSIGLLVRDDVSIADSVSQVHSQSPRMAPNLLILHHCQSLIPFPTLVHQVVQLVSRLDKRMWLWCNDCKIHFLDDEGHDCPGKHWTQE